MKKGFTLIELLAVILILGIIALIAIPQVNNIINEAKENANIVSVKNYIKATENFILEKELKNENLDCINNVNGCSVEQLLEEGLKVKGNIPESGNLLFNNLSVLNADLNYSDFRAQYNGNNIIILDKDKKKKVDLIDEVRNNNYQIDKTYTYLIVSINDNKLRLDSSKYGSNGQINFNYDFRGLNITRIYIKGKRIGDISSGPTVYYGVALLNNFNFNNVNTLSTLLPMANEEFVFDITDVKKLDSFAINMVLGIIELDEAYIEYEED